MPHVLDRPVPTRLSPTNVTRRGLLGGSLSAAALLALSACGAGPDEAAAATGTTVEVDTINGSVQLPPLPTAVLATSFEIVTALIDLGVKPLATTSYVPSFAAYTDAVKGLPVIDDAQSGQLDLEKIASLAPDVILGSDWAAEAERQQPYTKLTAIAPTALFEWKQAAGNWRAEASGVAGALGRQEQLAALETAYAERCAAMKATYAELFASTTFDIVTYTAGQPNWYLYSSASSHGQVMADVGMRFGAAAGQKAGYAEMSLEKFEVLESTGAVIAGGPGTAKALAKQKSFTALPAVRAGHVYPTLLTFPSGYSISMGLIDDLEAACTKLQAR